MRVELAIDRTKELPKGAIPILQDYSRHSLSACCNVKH
ncbi:Uncharacterised protein [Citrobacter freundii]|nr:hypothetical protein AZ007_001995 [Citrobacter freundii]VDZ58590.1 Uncharacterised protein [Citrobacter freundii]